MRFNFWQGIFIGLIILFLLAGVRSVPFHGDESTIISMSKDYFRLAHDGNFAGQALQLPPPNPDFAADQELRLLNGVTTKYFFGLQWSLAGGDEGQINRQWLWGADWAFNAANGHMPSAALLFISRWVNTLCLCLAVAFLFAAAKQIAGPWCGWGTILPFVAMPAVLLNGRRAVFEGAFILGTAMLVFATVLVVKHLRKHKPLGGSFAFLAGAMAFALASKHTSLIPIAASLAIIGLTGLFSQHLLKTMLSLVCSGMVAIITVFALNPAYWPNPLAALGQTWRLRNDVLAGQTAYFGGFASPSERLLALFTAPFGAPQYYEDKDPRWADWLADSIAAYDPHNMMRFAPLALLALAAIALLGLFRMRRWPASGMATMAMIAFWAFALLISNPLPWQRYYLLLNIGYALLIGIGVAAWRAKTPPKMG
jgi:hypothetical protein